MGLYSLMSEVVQRLGRENWGTRAFDHNGRTVTVMGMDGEPVQVLSGEKRDLSDKDTAVDPPIRELLASLASQAPIDQKIPLVLNAPINAPALIINIGPGEAVEGLSGEQGEQGPPGPEGPPGADAPAPIVINNFYEETTIELSEEGLQELVQNFFINNENSFNSTVVQQIFPYIENELDERTLLGTADAYGLYGNSVSFTTTEGTISALVRKGLVISGKTYVLQKISGVYVVMDPVTNVTATSSQFFTSTAGSGDFTVGSLTITANLTRGLCFNAKEYGLTWADDTQFSVIDPELRVTGEAADNYVLGDSASFTVSGETLAAFHPGGFVFDGHDYELAWNDDQWMIANPVLVVPAVLDGAATENNTVTASVYERTGDTAYTDTDKNVTALDDMDEDLASGAKVTLAYEGGGRWAIIRSDWECPEE